MNSITDSLLHTDNNAIFVDDLVGMVFANNWEHAGNRINFQFDNLFIWSSPSQQRFHPDKFKMIDEQLTIPANKSNSSACNNIDIAVVYNFCLFKSCIISLFVDN